MKNLTLAILFFLMAFFPITSNAGDSSWSAADKEREAAFFATHIINWIQQRDIANHPQNFSFANKTTGDVDVIFLFTAALQPFVASSLPDAWRGNFQMLTIGFELGQVSRNFHIGAKIRY